MKYLISILLALMFVYPVFSQDINKGCKAISYRGFVELGGGTAYNLNTAQTISTVNMQIYWSVTTSHGISYEGLYAGIGVGYNHTQCDKENMYLTYADVRYVFEKCKVAPSLGLKAGIMYDPYWIEKVQKYAALTISIGVYKGLGVGLEGSIFSRPSRHFTVNALFVVSYTIGK